MPQRIAEPKIACLDFSLQKSKMHMGVQVLIEDPAHLDGVRQRFVRCFHAECNGDGLMLFRRDGSQPTCLVAKK